MQENSEILLNVSEAGRILGVSDSTVWRMIRRGAIPSIFAGGRRLIPRDALQREAAERKIQEIAPLHKDHPFFRLVGAGRSGGSSPGARNKHAILDR